MNCHTLTSRFAFSMIYPLLVCEDHYKEQNFVLDAMRLKCSADRLGEPVLPFHIIYGGGLMESELTLLMRILVAQNHEKTATRICRQR